MSTRTIQIWLITTVLLAPVLAPFLARGDAQNRQLRVTNQQLIADMSESERQRLERNYESFKRMSPEEQTKARTFHQELNRDQTEGQGELTHVLHDYQAWLTTLSPYERDQLANAANPQERITLMKKIVERQRERTAARSMQRGPQPPPGDDPMNRSLDRVRRFWMDMPVLSQDELRRVMQAIEQQTQFQITETQWKEIQQLEGVERFTRLLRAIKASENSPHLLMVPPMSFKSVAERIDQLTENSAVREFMASSDPSMRFSRETRLMGLLLKTLRVRLMEDQKLAAQKPTESQLSEFFATLSEAEQDQLLSLASSAFYADLLLQYPRPNQKVNERDLEELAPWPGPGRDMNNPDRRPLQFGNRGPGDREGRPPRGPDGPRGGGENGERPDGGPFPDPRGPRPDGPPPSNPFPGGFRPEPPPDGQFPPPRQPAPAPRQEPPPERPERRPENP